MNELFTDTKEFLSKWVSLTALISVADPIVGPLRAGVESDHAHLWEKVNCMANPSGSRVFASPGNNYRNTQSLKGNIWLAGGKLANTQSK